MSWRLCGNWTACALSGKGILARPMETNFHRPSSGESVREECATMKKHETNFRRPSSVESVRDECATMKKQELAAPLNVIQFDGSWSKCKTSVQQSWDIELVSTISLAFTLLATPALRLALLRRDVSQWFLEMKFDITAWWQITIKLSNKCCIVTFGLESVLFFVDTDLNCDSVINMRLICCNLLHLHLRTFHICRSALSLSTFACTSFSSFGSFNHLLPCHDSSLRIL